MINKETMEHFRLFRNPFIDDVQKESDIHMSEEHRFVEAAMLDAARHGGFLAVVGEVGAGKSVMRKKVVEQLRRDGDVLVVFPQMVDKTRLTAPAICDSIILDISSEKPRIKLEDKSRQVQRLLLDRSKAGYRHVLIIEEAHDLSVSTLKYLKRFYELEDGFRKLLGILLIGQPELERYFNEQEHTDMREVIRRCQVTRLKCLNGDLGEYLAMKFKRVGADLQKIFDPEGIEALRERLTTADRYHKKISHTYPLLVNNLAARAMNLASELGAERVTAEIVMKA
ncbi:MAG: ExeA family protein [Nitrospirae bacterium]|nr:ExeA family protein [Nitrospirota bacterium]